MNVKKYFLVSLLILSFGMPITVHAEPSVPCDKCKCTKEDSKKSFSDSTAERVARAGDGLLGLGLLKWGGNMALAKKATLFEVISGGLISLGGMSFLIAAFSPDAIADDTFTSEEHNFWTSVDLAEDLHALNQSPENLILQESALNALLIASKGAKYQVENSLLEVERRQELLQKIGSDIQLLTDEHTKTQDQISKLSEKTLEEYIKDSQKVHETMRQDNIREKIIEENTAIFAALKTEASK